MRINHMIKTDQWRAAPQIRPTPHFVVSRNRSQYLDVVVMECHEKVMKFAYDILVGTIEFWHLPTRNCYVSGQLRVYIARYCYIVLVCCTVGQLYTSKTSYMSSIDQIIAQNTECLQTLVDL